MKVLPPSHIQYLFSDRLQFDINKIFRRAGGAGDLIIIRQHLVDYLAYQNTDPLFIFSK
jgi:hypothetical protein